MQLVERIARLVGTPSVSSTSAEHDLPNRPVIDLLAEWFEDAGFRCEVMPVTPDGQKANLIATRGQGPGGLVLSGHSDTVPFDSHSWHSDPFKLTERDGKLYGLGSADMKSFFAVALEAAARFDAADLQAPLVVLATADEECSMSGARALVHAGRSLGRHAIIGEPTGMRPIRMHKGVSMESIELTGRSGHSSDPSLGRNALDGMRRAMNAMVDFEAALAKRHRRDALTPPITTFNLGSIRGGDNPNRICGHCVLQHDIRLLPGLDFDEVRAGLHAEIERAIEGLELTFRGGALHEPVPPFETPADAEIVRACEALTGFTAGTVAFGTEAPYLSSLGLSTVVMGPGDIAVAHQPNEHIALDALPSAVDTLARLIERFCGGAGE
ncbi:MAG: acetylornithine deacetylase [Bradymonadia bacterium]